MRQRFYQPDTHSQSGLSLLEVILSIAIVSIAIISLVVVTITALTTVRESRDQARADQYARQTIESLRVIRDQAGWQEFLKPDNSATSPALEPSYYGIYSLTEASGDDLPRLIQHGVSTTTEPQNGCGTMHSSDYAITGSGGFYRQVMLYYPDPVDADDATRVEITVSICHSYRQGIGHGTSIQTYLTNWQ